MHWNHRSPLAEDGGIFLKAFLAPENTAHIKYEAAFTILDFSSNPTSKYASTNAEMRYQNENICHEPKAKAFTYQYSK